MANQTELNRLTWRNDRVPVSTRFDDPYFSLEDGLAETHHVFLAGNDLPARFSPGFHIAELGFGTGLNLLAAWAAWEDAGQKTQLQFTSFEAFPLPRKDLTKAHVNWPELRPYAERFLDGFNTQTGKLADETLSLEVIYGDARKTLIEWTGSADAWFLDGFSPAKNPELWSPELLREVGCHTKKSGSFATYSAAGHVRRALDAAGFEVTRAQGFGRKRHMLKGCKR